MKHIKKYNSFLNENSSEEFDKLKIDFLNKFPKKSDFDKWRESVDDINSSLIYLFQCDDEYSVYFDKLISELGY